MNSDECEKSDLSDRTFDFSRRVIRLYSALPRSTLAQVLGKQLLRSVTSIGANYREAKYARSRPEFIAKIGECMKETAETEYWLDLIITEKIINPARTTLLRSEAGQLAAIFTAILKSSKQQTS